MSRGAGRSRSGRPDRSAWLLAAPVAGYFGLFLVYPMAYALRLAFTDPLSGTVPSLANFATLWRDRLFWRAALNNVLIPVLTLALELASGLALALLLHQRWPGRRVLRAVAVLPFAVPEIVFLTIMRYIFAPRGYANAALAALGFGPVAWLRPGSVLALGTVVLVDAWHVTPVVFLLLLTALAAMPPEVHEAARLDGAGAGRRFLFITLPLLRPALVAAVLLRGLDALRIFATPLVLTGVEGVPVLSTYAYHQWADYGDEPAAAAAAAVLAGLAVFAMLPFLRRLAPAFAAERGAGS